MKEKILISACLLGINCKYNGGNNYNEELINKLKNKYDLIPICPEIYGGLATPRKPSEIKENRVVNIDNEDVTDNYKKGAIETLKIAKILNVHKAILKSKSPSCGKGQIYNGEFNNTLIEGNGITTKLLLENNIEVISDKEI